MFIQIQIAEAFCI